MFWIYISFNSLQTGRTFRTEDRAERLERELAEFQFPSNGKDFPNLKLKRNDAKPQTVSIPFKREGLSEL